MPLVYGGYCTEYDDESATSTTYGDESPSSTVMSPVIPDSTTSCVPSYLNSTWSTSGYQAIYAANYEGCALDPYNAEVGFVSLHHHAHSLNLINTDDRNQRLVSANSQEMIVNVNGKAQIPRDPSDWEDSYYTFENNADICG